MAAGRSGSSIEAGVARAVELGGEGPVCALGTLYFSGDVRKAFAELVKAEDLKWLRVRCAIISGKIFLYLQIRKIYGFSDLLFSRKKLLLVQRAVAWDRLKAFIKFFSAGYVLFCVPKREPERTAVPAGMKAPVGLLSRRPVCAANAACSARQGLRYFRGAGGGGLRLPASALCLARHSHPAGRCPNSSSLFRPLAAVVAVAN